MRFCQRPSAVRLCRNYKMDSFHPVMPDPDPASSAARVCKPSGFPRLIPCRGRLIKPGMRRGDVAFLIVTQPLRASRRSRIRGSEREGSAVACSLHGVLGEESLTAILLEVRKKCLEKSQCIAKFFVHCCSNTPLLKHSNTPTNG